MARVLIIVNPVAGRGMGASLAPRIERILREAGHETRTHITRKRGEPKQSAGSDDAHWADGLLAVGGDGTVNEVINGRGDLPLSVGVVPLGTGNVLAKEIGIGARLHNVESALDPVKRWSIKPMDLVELDDGRRFSCMLTAGIEGRIVRALEGLRSGGTMKMSSYVPLGLKALLGSREHNIRMVLDGKEIARGLSFVNCANTRSFGGPMEWVPQARGDDGKLDVLYTKLNTQIAYPWMAFLALFGRVRHMGGIHFASARNARLEAEGAPEVHYQIDGDYGGTLPVEMRVIPAALTVFAKL